MKALFTKLFILSYLSLFAGEVGESKIVLDSSQEKEKKEAPATISK